MIFIGRSEGISETSFVLVSSFSGKISENPTVVVVSSGCGLSLGRRRVFLVGTSMSTTSSSGIADEIVANVKVIKKRVRMKVNFAMVEEEKPRKIAKFLNGQF